MAVCIAYEAQFEHSKDKCYTIAHSLGEIAKEFCNDSEKTKMMINAVDATVDVYVYYDGDDSNVYSDNLTNLTSNGVTITFEATPKVDLIAGRIAQALAAPF